MCLYRCASFCGTPRTVRQLKCRWGKFCKTEHCLYFHGDRLESQLHGVAGTGIGTGAGAGHTSTSTSYVERRVDPSDGGAFTRDEFIDFYGGTAEWDRALPLRPVDGVNSGGTTFTNTGGGGAAAPPATTVAAAAAERGVAAAAVATAPAAAPPRAVGGGMTVSASAAPWQPPQPQQQQQQHGQQPPLPSADQSAGDVARATLVASGAAQASAAAAAAAAGRNRDPPHLSFEQAAALFAAAAVRLFSHSVLFLGSASARPATTLSCAEGVVTCAPAIGGLVQWFEFGMLTCWRLVFGAATLCRLTRLARSSPPVAARLELTWLSSTPTHQPAACCSRLTALPVGWGRPSSDTTLGRTTWLSIWPAKSRCAVPTGAWREGNIVRLVCFGLQYGMYRCPSLLIFWTAGASRRSAGPVPTWLPDAKILCPKHHFHDMYDMRLRWGGCAQHFPCSRHLSWRTPP